MLASPSHILHFDEFTLDCARCVLLRGASELPLRRQSFEVLRYLAEHAGKVVSSDELIEALWSSKPADHNASVGQCIKEIRRAIGDDARWIVKTVSGRGYRVHGRGCAYRSASAGGSSFSTGMTPRPWRACRCNCTRRLRVKVSYRLRWRPSVHRGEPNRLLAVALAAALVAGGWMLWPWRHAASPSPERPHHDGVAHDRGVALHDAGVTK